MLYVPWLALRDFWQLARYENLNMWQFVIQSSEDASKILRPFIQQSKAVRGGIWDSTVYPRADNRPPRYPSAEATVWYMIAFTSIYQGD